MDVAGQRQLLLDQRDTLLRDIAALDAQLHETPPRDWEDRASERQGDEVLEGLERTEWRALKRIDAALERLASGTYGVCQSCGGRISEARLVLLPDTPFCKSCAH